MISVLRFSRSSVLLATAVVLVGISLSGCARHRYYTLSSIVGVREIDVARDGRVAAIVRDPHRVEQIVNFMNSRSDRWFDPQGIMFAQIGDLIFRDARQHVVAEVSFGLGGMAQERPSMTYRDSNGVQPFLVIRGNGYPGETERDSALLCDILGPRLYHLACEY